MRFILSDLIVQTMRVHVKLCVFLLHCFSFFWSLGLVSYFGLQFHVGTDIVILTNLFAISGTVFNFI